MSYTWEAVAMSYTWEAVTAMYILYLRGSCSSWQVLLVGQHQERNPRVVLNNSETSLLRVV